MTILDTAEQIKIARLCIIRSGLKLEIKTGLRHSRNLTFNAAKQITGKQTRIKCLDEINKLLEPHGL